MQKAIQTETAAVTAAAAAATAAAAKAVATAEEARTGQKKPEEARRG